MGVVCVAAEGFGGGLAGGGGVAGAEVDGGPGIGGIGSGGVGAFGAAEGVDGGGWGSYYHSLRLLDNIEGIGVVHLESGDVVRHRLVKAIINAYDKDDEIQAIRKHEREQERQDISNVENPEKS